MPSARDRADGYRKEAQSCLEIAERMSLESDRLRMFEMAKRWLDLAAKADAKARSGEG